MPTHTHTCAFELESMPAWHFQLRLLRSELAGETCKFSLSLCSPLSSLSSFVPLLYTAETIHIQIYQSIHTTITIHGSPWMYYPVNLVPSSSPPPAFDCLQYSEKKNNIFFHYKQPKLEMVCFAYCKRSKLEVRNLGNKATILLMLLWTAAGIRGELEFTKELLERTRVSSHLAGMHLKWSATDLIRCTSLWILSIPGRAHFGGRRKTARERGMHDTNELPVFFNPPPTQSYWFLSA